MRILITGGHLSPALAVIEELKKTKKDIDIVFVGRKYALDSEKTVSLEYKEIKKLNIPFIPIRAGRLTRVPSLKSLINLIRIPIGFVKAYFIVNEAKPDLVFSFGSYVALPIVFWSYLKGITVFAHEQTVRPGLANRIIGRMSKKIFVSFDEAKQYFDPPKTVVSGNPVRRSVMKVINKPFGIPRTHPVIYITGGSLGSHGINEHIKKIIVKLLNSCIVIHQTGDTKEYHDYEDLADLRKSLPIALKNRYFLRKFFYEDEVGYIFSVSDLVVSRCGANTFFELLALSKPAVVVPLPWSAGREQQSHAEILARAGVAEIFHQVESSNKLLNIIDKMIKNLKIYKNNFKSLRHQYKENAARYLAEEIFAENP